jgi:sensor histidine kinase YesM
MIHHLVQTVYDNREYRFWFCQLVGWAGYAIGTFLTITLVDGNISWPHVGHISLSALLGVLASWPLRYLYRSTFENSIWSRLVIATLAVILLSAVWTAARIQGYAWIANEPAIWDEVHYWYFGSLFVFLSWTVLYYGIKYYDLLTTEHQKLLQESAQKRAEQLRRSQAESAAREAQLKMLRYQLNPHFLFNTLNAINALVRLKDSSRAQNMIQLLSNFLRHTLEQDSVANVTLEQELDTLMLYLDIEKARFEDRLVIDFAVEASARQAMVPSLILQPIIENAMKHAIADSEEGGSIMIAARVQSDLLRMEIADSGPGMGAKQNSEGRGIGLRNTRERLETLYGDQYSFDITDREPSGLMVSISLPLELAQSTQQQDTRGTLVRAAT